MRFVRVFTRAVNSRCHHWMVKFPRSEEERRKTALQFHEWSGMTGVLGCIDGSHIWITPTKADTAIYANRKQYMPIILSAVVDGMGRFIDINIGMPGLGSRFVVCFAIIKKRNRTHAMAHAIELSIRPKIMANHNCHLPRLSHPPCAFSHFRFFSAPRKAAVATSGRSRNPRYGSAASATRPVLAGCRIRMFSWAILRTL